MSVPDRATGFAGSGWLENDAIAARLDDVARLLRDQEANPFRVRAYRTAAEAIRNLPVPVAQVFHDQGMGGLERMRNIGPAIARAIRDLLTLGRLPMLERLRGEGDPVRLLSSVPGIGSGLAERLHQELGVETLEELELAAHDGRLAGITGFGPKRIAGVRGALAARLGRSGAAGEAYPAPLGPAPSVAELLDVDREYRAGAKAGRLPMIAPRRFNPKGAPGCRCSTPCGASGTIPRSSPTPPWPIAWAGPTTGWCSTAMAPVKLARRRWSPRMPGRFAAAGWCGGASWSARVSTPLAAPLGDRPDPSPPYLGSLGSSSRSGSTASSSA